MKKRGKIIKPFWREIEPLQQSVNSDVQTQSCKGETLPAQETVAARKGLFEETGLGVRVKGQPTE